MTKVELVEGITNSILYPKKFKGSHSDRALKLIKQYDFEKWISVKDRLPKVLCEPFQVIALAKKRHYKGNYKGQQIKSIVQNWVVWHHSEKFTHWQSIEPLPEPPQ